MGVRVIRWPDFPRWIQDVQLDGKVYALRVSWNSRMGTWVMDIYTGDGQALMQGIRVVAGWPLLPRGAREGLPPGELFVVNVAGRYRQDPGRRSMGESGDMQLIYIEAENDAV